MDLWKDILKLSEHRVFQNGLVQKKKKKCRGNRKLQRFRRSTRRKAMSNQANEMLNLIKEANNSIYKNIEQMDEFPLINADHICAYENSEENLEFDLRFEPSYLSESEMESECHSVISIIYPKKAKCYNLCTDHWKQLLKIKPNYKKLTYYEFKDVLIKTIPVHSHHHIKNWLTNITMLDFLKHRAELIATVFQLRIELDYWNYIADLTIHPVVIWLLEIGKDGTKKNSINWDHTKRKAIVQKQQKKIQKQLQKAERDLNFHLQQPYPFECELTNKTALFSFMNVIANGLITLAENNLNYLRTNFEQKKILLNFDITNANLVKSFYDLNPTEEQIVIVRKTWRDQLNVCKKVIRQKKKNSSSSIYQQIAWKNGAAVEQDPLLLNGLFSASMYQIIQDRLKNMKKRTKQLLGFVQTIDDNIFF
ncbi:unnamed protein product [Rotaria sordida]|uniref:Uncharacterized protein n=1 Tax=Rotaria sordida TaxID=392033 RepID=A0A815XJR9_9BILA|nr:unnamed protein product [Rotaria sordida]CAF1558439.1 unnamed protein product [Rotaria sordida]